MSTIIPGLYGLDSATAWKALQKDPQKYIDAFTKSNKQLQTDTDYFAKVLGKSTTIADVLKDPRAAKYLLESYGLGTETDSIGLIKKVLTEDPTATGALSSKLADTRYATMAKALRTDKGLDTLKNLVSTGALKTNYIQNEFEETLGQQDNALRQAAYFARNTNSISNVYSVLGDKILRDVVTSTYSIPKEIAIQSVETQAKVVAAKIDVTKFIGTGTTTVSNTQLTTAKSDHDAIGNDLAASDAAISQLTTLQSQLAQLGTDYSNLDAITDPNGVNANLIPIQQAAVPELARYQQLLGTSDKTLGLVNTNINLLNGLITQAQQPGSDLNALKTQFSSIVSDINDLISKSNTTTFNGSENILLNGTADTISTVVDENGTTVTLNRYDATNIQDLINQADTAFNAVTDQNDLSNIFTAASRLLRGQDANTAIHNQVTTDLTNLDNTTSTTFFAASLNSTDLLRGKQSIDDSLSRVSQVADLLGKIQDIASQSAALDANADRTDLANQFDTYRTQLRSLIENTGTAGLDNFLNGASTQNYEIINGKTIQVQGGFNLDTSIADVIDGLNLNDPASASNLETQAILLTNQTDTLTASLNTSKPVLDQVISTYDPRGRLDSQVVDLTSQIDTIISGAAKNSINLLSASQADIKLSVSTGTNLTFRSQSTFKNDFLSGVNNIISQFGNGTQSVLNAVDSLSDIVSTAQRNLQGDNRVATIEYGKLGATIDALDPKNTNPTSSLYQTNAFTQKFLQRYLTVAGSDGTASSSSGAGSYLTALFGDTSDTQASMSNLMSLALSIKA